MALSATVLFCIIIVTPSPTPRTIVRALKTALHKQLYCVTTTSEKIVTINYQRTFTAVFCHGLSC